MTRRSQKGFTLVELLCAIVVCLLATSLATLAIDMSSKSMNQQTREAEAQTLCSTLSTAISDELRFGRNFEKDAEATGDVNFSYFSASRKLGNNCRVVNQDGKILLEADGSSNPIVPGTAYTHNVKARCSLTLEDTGDVVTAMVCVYTDNDVVLAVNNFKVLLMTK